MAQTDMPVRLDVWSDYVCPFCYLELPILKQLHARLGAELDIHWRAFELRPTPARPLAPVSELPRSAWARAVYPMAEQRGLTMKPPPVQPRSRLALEAAEFAKDAGAFSPFHEALFRAFFEDGRDIGDLRVLADLAEDVGLDRESMTRALEASRYTARVLADEEEAQRLGIRGVPAMRLAGKGPVLLLNGAQPEEAVRAAFARVRPGPSLSAVH
ncbi:DsbA family oxidoreductase [Myxococcus xanthus]|uniref:Disulfide bond formation protein DsbA n=1 Tax=Myxococcus xanthus TaxID=34 RepID=A0AAE6FYL1_MYXXA|nr:DsbA family oxidoreductase [Myxococcus xanthus]QDE67426.1 disulfide bond formation protein DsbA [Myxococcus xanthus]QDE74702.1 disulfide bond formation protein DsbA [Myxococcus xanthus]QDE96290.1 disulfide bond formation protein DsbA [Myxococcus xanthus]